MINQFKQKKEKLGNLCDGDKLRGNITTAFFNFWIRNVAGELGFPINNDTVFITKEDKATGLQLYSSLVYCSTERDRALAFLEKLIFSNSPATLLLATVNTIQLAPTKDNVVWKAFRDFYKVLEKELDLKYGRILMALASPEELRAFKARDWPYLDLYQTELDKCLQGDCEGAQGVIQQLGTIYWFDILQIFKVLKFQIHPQLRLSFPLTLCHQKERMLRSLSSRSVHITATSPLWARELLSTASQCVLHQNPSSFTVRSATSYRWTKLKSHQNQATVSNCS